MVDCRQVSGELSRKRLDAVVRLLFGISWAKSRAWIQTGKITVDGQVVTDLGAPLTLGASLVYTPDAPRPRGSLALHPTQIVWLDRHMVVAIKPSGLLTVPYEGDEENFARQLRRFLAKNASSGPRRRSAPPPLMVVHRLDKGTSGLLVFARTSKARQALGMQFREHSVWRRYIAVVHGQLDTVSVRSHLVRDRGDGLRGSAERSLSVKKRRVGQGKYAVTHVTAQKHYQHATLITCRLETGRTNQIRIHLSELGHPVVGDTVYLRGYAGPVLPAPRLMLHAAELGITHPITGEALRFEAPLPPELTEFLAGLQPRPE